MMASATAFLFDLDGRSLGVDPSAATVVTRDMVRDAKPDPLLHLDEIAPGPRN